MFFAQLYPFTGLVLETLVKKHNTKMIRFIVYQLFRYLPVLGPHFVLKTVWILPQEVNAMFV
jgi:hypothetical protein